MPGEGSYIALYVDTYMYINNVNIFSLSSHKRPLNTVNRCLDPSRLADFDWGFNLAQYGQDWSYRMPVQAQTRYHVVGWVGCQAGPDIGLHAHYEYISTFIPI